MKQRKLYPRLSVLGKAAVLLVACIVVSLAGLVFDDLRAEETGFDCVAARVINVKDGDTYDMTVPAWPKPFTELPLRPLDVDTPELRSQCDTVEAREREEGLALQATDAARAMLLGKTVLVCNYELGPFNRIIGDIYLDGANVGKQLLDAGLARPYVKGSDPWCRE